MNRFTPGQCLGQIFFWTLFAGCIGYFVGSPRYQHLPPNMATVKLSLVHAGQLLGECRSLSAEELARLPANMRAPQVCPRERSPLILELLVNGEALVSESIAPKGLHGDGRAAFYRRLTVLSGPVEVKVRMKDNVKASDFNYTAEYKTELAPAEVLVIDFNTEQKRFTFLQCGAHRAYLTGVCKQVLNELKARKRKPKDDGEEHQAAVFERRSTSGFDLPQQPVGKEVKAQANDGEQENLHRFSHSQLKCR